MRQASAAVAPEVADGAGPESAGDASGVDREQIVGKFEESLRKQLGQDNADLESALGHFRQAVEDVPLEPHLTGPDLNTWIETLEALVSNGLLAEEEREALIRQFGEAMSPLQSRDVQVALEFAERVKRDGDEKALEWLNAQRQAQAGGQPGAARPSGASGIDGKQEITRSRSRRLRGPPRLA